jgi:hypothetical protein
MTGGKIPTRQLEEITVVGAQDCDAFYSVGKTDQVRKTTDILAMSIDLKGIVMRKEDLRAATRKAAEESVRRPGARLNPGERRNRNRMASVAAVYDIKAHQRSPEEIMGQCSDEEKSVRLIRRYRPDASRILDFIHVLEYLWKGAYGFHPVGSVEAENWVADQAFKILQGKAAHAFSGPCSQSTYL